MAISLEKRAETKTWSPRLNSRLGICTRLLRQSAGTQRVCVIALAAEALGLGEDLLEGFHLDIPAPSRNLGPSSRLPGIKMFLPNRPQGMTPKVWK